MTVRDNYILKGSIKITWKKITSFQFSTKYGYVASRDTIKTLM